MNVTTGSPGDAETERIRVLHVDDQPGFVDMAAEFLRRENARLNPVTAVSAPEGLEYLADNEVHCVVSDYDMPGMNGLEFLAAVREEDPDLPFILFTGKGSEEVASDAVSAGVTDYLQKESGRDQYTILANRIVNAVDAYRSQREARRLERINALIREIHRRLVEASSVETIEEAVCAAFGESESYRFAWIGGIDPEAGEVVPRAAAGDAERYLDEVTIRYDDSTRGSGPGGRAVRTRTVQVVQNIPDDPAFEPWRATAEKYGYESVIVLPLVHDGTLHGILPIYADHAHAFGESERAVLEELAGTISEAIGAAKTRRRLRQHEQELRTKTRAMDEAPIGITITDPSRDDNPLIYVNRAFERLTGYAEAEALGRNCRFLQGEGTDPAAVAELREAIDAREPVQVELRNYRKDGTAFRNRVTVAPVEDEDGEVVHYVGFQQAVTDRGE